jgi:hypothetical protein
LSSAVWAAGVRGCGCVVVGFERGSSLYRVLGGMIGSDGSLGPVAQLNEGRLGGQRERGACRSEGLVAGQHVPDRLGEPAGDLDLGDFGAALAAEALLGVLVRSW